MEPKPLIFAHPTPPAPPGPSTVLQAPPGAPGAPGGAPGASPIQIKIKEIIDGNPNDFQAIAQKLEEEIEAVIRNAISSDEVNFSSILQGSEKFYEPKLQSAYSEVKNLNINDSLAEKRQQSLKAPVDLAQQYKKELQKNIDLLESKIINCKGKQFRKVATEEPLLQIKTYEEELSKLKLEKGKEDAAFEIILIKSIQDFEHKRLAKRLDKIPGGLVDKEFSESELLNLRNLKKQSIRQELGWYYEAWVGTKIDSMLTAQLSPVEILESLSNTHKQYTERLKLESSSDSIKNLSAVIANIEDLSGGIHYSVSAVTRQKEFNVALKDSSGDEILKSKEMSLVTEVLKMESLVEEAIKLDTKVQIADLKQVAAYIKANIIKRICENRFPELSKTKKKTEQEKKVEREKLSERSKLSHDKIFTFDLSTTLYTQQEIITLAKAMRFKMDIETLDKDFKDAFEPFENKDVNSQKLFAWMIRAQKQPILQQMIEADGITFKPREFIENSLNIADINLVLTERMAERTKANKQSVVEVEQVVIHANGQRDEVKEVKEVKDDDSLTPVEQNPALVSMMGQAENLETLRTRCEELLQKEIKARRDAEVRAEDAERLLKEEAAKNARITNLLQAGTQSPAALRELTEAALGPEQAARVAAEQRERLRQKRRE